VNRLLPVPLHSPTPDPQDADAQGTSDPVAFNRYPEELEPWSMFEDQHELARDRVYGTLREVGGDIRRRTANRIRGVRGRRGR
jgi:hypothetical protein